MMLRNIVVASCWLLASSFASAQWFGHGSDLTTMANFKEGKFSFETKKLLGWYYVVKWRVAGDPFVPKLETINGWAKLYMPVDVKGKVPVIILIHGSGGLFTRDGRERYVEYVEDLLKNNIGVALIDVYGPRTSGNMVGASTRYTWDAIYVHTACGLC